MRAKNMASTFTINTSGRGLIDITDKIRSASRDSGIDCGIMHVFIPHTSASLIIQENADPDVCTDLMRFFDRIAPEGDGYRHMAEGPDDMPAHIKAALTATSLAIPILDGELALGVWQGVYLFEHRTAPHCRRVIAMTTREA
ncbi:MAG: secondary thiamine-phosphate synthase enzyme YjbQ [Hyphococcus sp.]